MTNSPGDSIGMMRYSIFFYSGFEHMIRASTSRPGRHRLCSWASLVAMTVLATVACEGKTGETGTQGPRGERGERGPAGPAGTIYSVDDSLLLIGDRLSVAPRNVAIVTGTEESQDGELRAPALGRFLIFDKLRDDTVLRVTYQDTFGMQLNAGTDTEQTYQCEWEIQIGGASCEDPGPIRFVLWESRVPNGQDLRRGGTVFGYCGATTEETLTAGTYSVRVTVSPGSPPGGRPICLTGATSNTVYTGGQSASFTLEVEEVTAPIRYE